MKTKFALLSAVIALILSALIVPSQQAQVLPGSPAALQNEPPHFFIVDRVTWEIKDPFNPGADLSSLNTFDLKMARYKALLQIEFPAEYAKKFPPTKEQVKAAKDSAHSIEHPVSLKKYLREKRSPEEQKALEEAVKTMFSAADAEKILRPDGDE